MNAKGLIHSQWFGFLFLMPFVVLLMIHDALGLSDALLLAKDQRDLDSRNFNLALGVAFGLGVGGFAVHTVHFRFQSRRWYIAKLSILVAGWAALILSR